MAPRSDLSAIAVGAAAAGTVLIWSGIKGASVLTTLTELIRGQKPAGENVYPIDSTAEAAAAGASAAAGSASSSRILQIAASMKGQPYCFGGGHGSGDPCAAKCTDCSTYVSCVITKATGRRVNMTTAGLAGIGQGVKYEQRQPGDIIVWNGGTGGGHTGIIATVKGGGGTMWNNSCKGCGGGVHISNYPYAGRSAAAAVVRRV